MKRYLWIVLLLGIFVEYPSTAWCESPNPSSAYGICAHLGGGEEFQQIPENFRRMREAGIRWVRADFSWIGVENPQGTWHFDHLDRVVQQAEENGITILPILNYDVPWATPAWKHLDAWKEYVTRIVTRYRDQIRYWEVWNEPNLQGFWHDAPSGANYAVLLKETYRTIKEIDPELQVVYGGLAGVPLDYFEDSLKADAGSAFDVMNIHPYRGGMITMGLVEEFQRAIGDTRQLMERYGAGEKPIWITEMGWATPPTFGETNRRIVSGSLKILFPDGVTGTCALLVDPRYPGSEYYPAETFQAMCPSGTQFETISLETLENIDPQRYPVLLLPPSECFPTPYFDSLLNYVQNGGTLFLLGGVPLYYETQWTEGGSTSPRRLTRRHEAPETYRERMRIGWFAWWTRPGTPETTNVKVAEDAKVQAIFSGYLPVMQGTRFFDAAKLRDGDRMIPLLVGEGKSVSGNGTGEDGKGDSGTGDSSSAGQPFAAPIAVIYDFGSDFTGNIVIASTQGDDVGQNISTVEDQARFLPQAILLARAAGVEKYFWYEFQAMEQDDFDKEHHFGIVHRNLDPKPAWQAYRTLTTICPDGSTDLTFQKSGENECTVTWKDPDGRPAHFTWSPSGKEPTQVVRPENTR